MATTTLATTRGTTLTPGLDGWFAVILSPDCGTVAGRTCFLVFYRVASGIDMAEFESCCRLHEPSGFVILIDEAEVIQIDVTDEYERSITTETDVTTMRNPEPGHYINPEQPWAWTLISGLPETVTHTDPDERGLFEVRPRPAEVPTDSGAPDTERQAPARGTPSGRTVSAKDSRCCRTGRPGLRHIPHPADILAEQAALVEIVLEDANGKTVVSPNGVEAWIKEDGADVPIHIPSIIPVVR